MLSYLTLFALLGAALSATVPLAKPVDNDAIFSFGMVGAQRAKKDIRPMVELGTKGIDNLSLDDQIFLLESGGLSAETIDFALDILLPKLRLVGRSSEEQAMALLMLAEKFCYRTKDGDNSCYGSERDFLSLVSFKAELGCTKKDILSWGLDSETREHNVSMFSESEMCQCFNQANPSLWMSLMNTFSGIDNNNMTIALLTNLFEQQCEGYLKSNKMIECTCGRVTEGHDSTFLHIILSNKDVLKNITGRNETQAFMQKKLKVGPTVRVGSSQLKDFLLRSMGANLDPMLLAFLTRNEGVSGSDFMKQMILSSLGVDASLAHLILSGGFGGSADTNKVAMINYLTANGALDPAIVPFMLKVENGKSFYLNSLISSGAIDPVMGLFIIGQDANVDRSTLLEIIMQSAAAPNREEYLQSIYAPYVPGLPAGIFPGSKLFFAHFELLGVNTCALHDLRNRFECGYTGITAAECETAPYCCYSPIFLDDTQVRAVTDNKILSASAIPWCYYNVFFVLFDTYHMEVKKAGEFASPIACPGLFKYGLQIDAQMYGLLNSLTSNPLAKYMNARTDCGFPGITEFHCVAVRGCCFDGSNGEIPGVPQCFKADTTIGAVNFNFDNLPVAYKPAAGSCNINRRQIPALYFKRTACHYTFEFYKAGYNALSIPNRIDCLTRLGCCYEDDDSVAEQYPFVPRCYRREAGAVAGLSTATLQKSGENADSSFLDLIGTVFPPHKKNDE